MNTNFAHRRATRLDRLTGVLARLDVPSRSVTELLLAVPDLVRQLGFDRAEVHRVEDGTADPQLAELIRDLHPVLVTGPAGYVAAPIVSGGRAIGVLQAHCPPGGRLLDEIDRDILAAFAAGLRMALATSVLHEQLLGTRTRVAELSRDLASVPGRITQIPSADDVLSPADGVPDFADVLPDNLTGRELEVLRLLASGCTNTMIANRLTIAEGTAKKHVIRVLRKLGVSNRSEAVARWFRSQQATPAGPVRQPATGMS